LDHDGTSGLCRRVGKQRRDLAARDRVHDGAALVAEIEAAVALAALRRAQARTRRTEVRRVVRRQRARAGERMDPVRAVRRELERARAYGAGLVAQCDDRIRDGRAARVDESAGHRARGFELDVDVLLRAHELDDMLLGLYVAGDVA